MGSLLGQPVLLSYVETGSMSPTLDPGDGFVAVPAQLAGPVEEGDVVTFRAEELHDGSLTTHRVVGETDRGFVTRGDANPFTDQDGEEPPVKRAQVVAVAWAPGGDVLVIPGVGAVVTGTQSALRAVQVRLSTLLGTRSLFGVQGLAYLLFGASVVWYLLAERGADDRRRERSRERESGVDARLFAAGFALLLVVGATAAMVAPAGTQTFGVVSAESDSPGLGVIERGGSESAAYSVRNGGVLPVVVYLDPASEGVAVDPATLSVPPRTTVNATLTLSAPPETGYYRRFLTEHRYLALLPRSQIAALYRLHPWAPVVAIDALLGVPFYLLGVVLLGTGRVRFRSRERSLPLSVRVRRLLRR
ncbi:signal peptidase I [Candidatus Halobonum tyrrellensis G22]|uniref:Signal peptidase I n=1 Tax=Candidatus Halobonum tyrrellensis G22 TaxID=1324957 RepID=V4J2B8_9EURY|nr:signal peptidase I [Candidatus Halobonum tyrrellensis G22]